MGQVKTDIEATLAKVFSPLAVEVIDESQLHAGHRHGGESSHFSVTICASKFQGHSLVKRHRMVYEALDYFIQNGVHALKIQAKTPEELGLNDKNE